MPLHFSTELMPLRVVGPKSNDGKPSVIFNLPAAQDDVVFDGVANVPDPNGHNTKAIVAASVTFLVGGGWGTNGACLATGGLARSSDRALIVVPVWWGGFITVGAPAACVAADKLHEVLREEEPRILGSNDRLNMSMG
ncbi:uncharacterized protein ColSpa_01921 [Colletotrichum spaethianum]|uniref:Uncharacterized protein n=1 Tax=Colletotrichum spaethianum TaxID=700344 RepID=A0AA37L985_9PEZI|nr:uncharacterized protein ColSpa_01921 [Colletotrichum spaethianum]GKT41740.1 hypothetical protein ColSpa_01921 [Colletotrichum spaethianum]